MGILEGLKNGINEKFSSEPEWKGHRFEKYIEKLFPEKDFQLVEKTLSYQENKKRFAERSLFFDFIFRDRKSESEFAVQAKYRSHLTGDGMLNWSNYEQMKKYQEFSKNEKIPYYVIIGLDGLDDNPERMFCIPLTEAKYPTLFRSVFKKYERNPKEKFSWIDGKLR